MACSFSAHFHNVGISTVQTEPPHLIPTLSASQGEKRED